MAQPIIISVPPYLVKKGMVSVLQELIDSQLVFIDELEELNPYINTHAVYAVIIHEQLLEDEENRSVFFQLKDKTKYILLSEKAGSTRYENRFDAQIHISMEKEELLPVLQNLLHKQSNSDKGEPGSVISKREAEVLRLIALGYTNQQIADQLFISKHTVITHRKNITSKLGIKTVSGLTVYAVLNNLIPKDQIQ